MGRDLRRSLADYLPLLCCPGCGADLGFEGDELRCSGCDHLFADADGIPQLFWPHDEMGSSGDVTESMKAFYEETPFPDYDDFDSVASLIQKARAGMFARLLDEQAPTGALILECGCGTGQLSNFLSVSNRDTFGTDMCLNSLRLGENFRSDNELNRAHFIQMNLFRPVFKSESFDLVISNGVLHHTADPFRAFESISKLVRPGGYILVGLYHRYGRLITDFRRLVFRAFRDRLTGLDPNLRSDGFGAAKRRAWFMDQYKNPHESKHTIGEVLAWLDRTGFSFVKSIPRSKPFQPFSDRDRLFEPEEPGNALERLVVELGMFFQGSREGGFFIVIGRRKA